MDVQLASWLNETFPFVDIAFASYEYGVQILEETNMPYVKKNINHDVEMDPTVVVPENTSLLTK